MADKMIVGTFNLQTGSVKIEAHGFRGKGCAAAMLPYENAVLAEGAELAVNKPEYDQSSSGSSDQSTVRA